NLNNYFYASAAGARIELEKCRSKNLVPAFSLPLPIVCVILVLIFRTSLVKFSHARVRNLEVLSQALWSKLCMPFTADELRYHIEQSFPILYAYLQQRARRYLGPLQFDTFEMDLVVEHVIEQLVRLGILGSGDHVPENTLDRLNPAQFYAFLNHSVRNK